MPLFVNVHVDGFVDYISEILDSYITEEKEMSVMLLEELKGISNIQAVAVTLDLTVNYFLM